MLQKNSLDISLHSILHSNDILAAPEWCAHAKVKIAMSVILRDRS
jgi:hypothetical protein